MKFTLILLSALVVTGCNQPTTSQRLYRDGVDCHVQGYGGMLVQVQTRRNSEGKRTGNYVMTTSCAGAYSGPDAPPVAPKPTPDPRGRRYDA